MTWLDALVPFIVGPIGGYFHVWCARLVAPPGRVRLHYLLFLSALNGFLALLSLPDRIGGAIGSGLAMAICLYFAWREWRKGRQKKPSRVAGVVRDLGHRLTIQPVPDPA